MWDLAAYYRQIPAHPCTYATHLHTWVQDAGPSIVLDTAVMFGDAPASNWAMRLSGFVAHLTAEIANRFCPDDERAQLSARLLDWARENAGAATTDGRFALVHTFVTAFIDDFSM